MAPAITSIPWIADEFSTTWRAHLLGDAQQFPIFWLLLGVPLLGCHPLQFLHTAAGAACAIGEALCPTRPNLMEVSDQARNRAHGIPQ